jgi:hypothetical protein
MAHGGGSIGTEYSIDATTLEREVIYVVAATYSYLGYDSIAIRVTATPSQIDALLCHLQQEDMDPAMLSFLIGANNRYIVRTRACIVES